jgi:YihY family inner membrane protein
MDIMRPLRAFDGYQQRHTWLALPMGVLKKYADDQGGSLAAQLAYYAFVSLFPLLLVMVTILGFVLQGNEAAQDAVRNSVLSQFPVIGSQITLGSLKGHVGAVIVGVIVSIWGGLGVTNAAHNAFDQVWAVPMKDRPDFLGWRLRGLLLLGSLGILFIASSAVSGLITGLGGPAVKVGAILISLLVNFGLFLAAFRMMTAATVATSCLWIGVGTAAVLWEILQLVGGIYINHVWRHASSTYSQFALVIALFVWLHLGAQITIYSAEINVVLQRRLWPRSLFGAPESAADQETFSALAKVEERHESEEVDVSFQDEGTAQAPR